MRRLRRSGSAVERPPQAGGDKKPDILEKEAVLRFGGTCRVSPPGSLSRPARRNTDLQR
jgi:hypothetical protein